MDAQHIESLRAALAARKAELDRRLDRIKANVRRGLDADSKERARELEDQEVVDALGIEATHELIAINEALQRISDGSFGRCTDCNAPVGEKRLAASPYVALCIDCARKQERRTR